MQIDHARVADILQLDVTGKLGADDSLLDAIQKNLARGQGRFVVNLAGAAPITDSGIAQLVEARSRILEAGGYFALALPERLIPARSGWREAPFRFETAQEAVESLLRELPSNWT